MNSEVKSYQTINYIEKSIAGLDQETLNRYNYALGLILHWLKLVIAARKKDIIGRLVVTKGLREEREMKIEEEKQRMERRAAAC